MSLKDAKKLYEAIEADEQLQEEIKGIKTEEDLLEKVLKLAGQRGLEVSREDIQTLLDELASQSRELDEDELENVAGGGGSQRCDMKNYSCGVEGQGEESAA